LGLFWSAHKAHAFAIKKMDAATHALYANACSGDDRTKAYHAKLLQEARVNLAGTMTDQQIQAALAQLTCPICGCPLIA